MIAQRPFIIKKVSPYISNPLHVQYWTALVRQCLVGVYDDILCLSIPWRASSLRRKDTFPDARNVWCLFPIMHLAIDTSVPGYVDKEPS
jgi:hypothetical protein